MQWSCRLLAVSADGVQQVQEEIDLAGEVAVEGDLALMTTRRPPIPIIEHRRNHLQDHHLPYMAGQARPGHGDQGSGLELELELRRVMPLQIEVDTKMVALCLVEALRSQVQQEVYLAGEGTTQGKEDHVQVQVLLIPLVDKKASALGPPVVDNLTYGDLNDGTLLSIPVGGRASLPRESMTPVGSQQSFFLPLSYALLLTASLVSALDLKHIPSLLPQHHGATSSIRPTISSVPSASNPLPLLPSFFFAEGVFLLFFLRVPMPSTMARASAAKRFFFADNSP